MDATFTKPLSAVLDLTRIDLTPANGRQTSVYTLAAKAQPGDHIAVKIAIDGSQDGSPKFFWHHGIFMGPDAGLTVAHMHPDGNITVVDMEKFIGDARIAAIIDYKNDSPNAKDLTLRIVEWALKNPGTRQLKYDAVAANCECFACFCRTGRWESAQVLRIVQAVLKLLAPIVVALVTPVKSKK